jgi:hypothetical protein
VVRGLGSWIVLARGATIVSLAHLLRALIAHLGLIHSLTASHGCSARASEASLNLDALKILLVLKLLLDVLVALEKLVVFDLALLQSLIHACFYLLAKSIHLIGLLLDKGCLSGDNLLMALLHVAIALFILHLLCLDLNLVSLGILLLTGELTLNGLKVQELSRKLESER